MGGKGSGGYRRNAGPKSVPYKVRAYRVPKAYLNECTAELKAIILKYREKCQTSK